jgi:hypothetical protein
VVLVQNFSRNQNDGELRILGIIKTILPDGTTRPGQWTRVCDWPPDLFAAVATITERSGLYAEASFMAYWTRHFALSAKTIARTRKIGRQWAETASPPKVVATLWSQLVGQYGNAAIDDTNPQSLAWKKIVFELLTIADEACAGIGFSPARSSALRRRRRTVTSIQYLVAKDYLAWEKKRQNKPLTPLMGGDLLPYLPHSLCVRVPPVIACVQPKTSTPVVGCTLRSLTHNLALLPSIANVSTHWLLADNGHQDLEAFNLLIVPFPFHIPGKSFTRFPGAFPGGPNERVFALDPAAWMGSATPQEFADFLLGLIDEAQPELEPIHAVVMPETALHLKFANDVAGLLAKRGTLDLFITGVVAGNRSEPRNSAAIYRFFDGEVVTASFQSKHHRWLLNGDQVRRYHLGHVLDPNSKWWEKIDVGYRHCYVTLFRPQAALSVLVCEDLARYDPVLTVMNAIGPNLVIALLMDGPQLEHRWPGRYATVLADDPGSAVLTVTSLGMVMRSSMPGEAESREIALWKQPNGLARPLKLAKGDHALLVALTSRLVEQFTLDGRGDGGSTVQFELGAARGVRYRQRLPAGMEFRS